MVAVAVTAPDPVIAVGWLTVQVGASVVPEVVEETAHASATLPVKPLLGVTVTVEVVDAP